eukprot:TRINITY_DN9008_c0_g1_i1.p2 TRINITY_DN9008_c0_g1~~TRINITY_DN9008_c0_g1_i1.p2  ORF type:complete len:761 (+),score=336.21 TRINITY_DN9008_c0_g1_i1:96-2378(+)
MTMPPAPGIDEHLILARKQRQYVNLLDDRELAAFEKNLKAASVGLPDGEAEKKLAAIDWEKIKTETAECEGVERIAGRVARAPRGQRRGADIVRRRARAMVEELAAAVSPTAVSALLPVARVMFNRTYAGIVLVRDQLMGLVEVFAKARREKRTVILLPSHKSHMDYMVLQFLFFRLGLPAPAIAAGDNLNLPVIGRILRRMGAFFIRRSFGGTDGELYSAVVAGYLEALMRHGVNIKFFPEGGRSRSGKLLQPKIGLLGMLLEPIVAGRVEDAYIVPISVYYDRVMETGSYVSELLGGQKKKESVFGAIGSARAVMAMPKLGSVQVRLAAAFSVREYVQRQIASRNVGPERSFDPLTNRRHMQVLLTQLAYQVLDSINAVSSCTPTALVGTVLLTTRGRGVGRTELIWRVNWLRREIMRNGGRVPYFLTESTGEVVDTALGVLGDLVSTVEEGLLEPVYRVAKHFELSYYRNMVVHVFIEQAIIACAVHRYIMKYDAPEVSIAKLMPTVRFLSGLLKREYVFSGAAGRVRFRRELGQPAPSQSPAAADAPSQPANAAGKDDATMSTLMENFQAAVQVMSAAGALEPSDDPSVLRVEQLRAAKHVGGYELWSAHFTFLCMLVWPQIESYWLVLAGLHAVFSRGVHLAPEASFIKNVQAFAKTLYHLGNLHFYESVSQESLRRALQTYHEQAVVRRTKVEHDRRTTVVIQLGPEYQGSDGVQKLEQVMQEVASYRRRGRDQKAMEHYPETLAQLAFGKPRL